MIKRISTNSHLIDQRAPLSILWMLWSMIKFKIYKWWSLMLRKLWSLRWDCGIVLVLSISSTVIWIKGRKWKIWSRGSWQRRFLGLSREKESREQSLKLTGRKSWRLIKNRRKWMSNQLCSRWQEEWEFLEVLQKLLHGVTNRVHRDLLVEELKQEVSLMPIRSLSIHCQRLM